MKKLLLLLAITSLLGCDDVDKSAKNSKGSIASMIASGQEEFATECSNGNVTLKCEFLSSDLLGSGKWHYTTIYISNSGEVDINVDNEAFYKTDSDYDFHQGAKVSTLKFKGSNGSLAKVIIRNSNEKSTLTFDVYDKKSNRFAMSGTDI